ncbi:MAG TPA: hypothetical protein VEW67_02440 [Thermoleophilaceae bacterium]|nr:hypothetical protein [Thermoleophilaceae bacterium]
MRIKRLPSPAMAVAFAALFVAGAGGATAATGMLDGGDIKNNSITAKDVKNGSLLKKDFKRGQIPAGKRGPQGAQGVAGPAGRAGRDGTNGFGQLVYGQGVGIVPPGETGDDVVALCPDGTFPTGGDAFFLDDADELVPEQEVAVQGLATNLDGVPVAWIATSKVNGSIDELQLVVDVICANASQVGFSTTSQGKTKSKVAGLDRPGRLQVRRP